MHHLSALDALFLHLETAELPDLVSADLAKSAKSAKAAA